MGARNSKKASALDDRIAALESKVDTLDRQLKLIVRDYQRPKDVLLKLLAKG
jgi:hypothetical protein